MNSNNLISVIIPCFNNGIFLDETINSVLKQTYTDFEIIIVDDGSTDSFTKQYLSQLNQPKIRVFFKDNEGVSIARNFAINHSKGEYILPLDPDDLITEDYLELAVKVLNENQEVKLVSCEVDFFGYSKGSMHFPEYSLERLLARNLFVVSSMFRRKDFLLTSGFNSNMQEGFEDWDFWISLLKTGGGVFRINKTCFFYRIHKSSRNNQLKGNSFPSLRKQIYENHQEAYQQIYFDPIETFEYELIRDSMEYKVGVKILKPLRFIQKIIHR